jgi:hypothetical protein
MRLTRERERERVELSKRSASSVLPGDRAPHCVHPTCNSPITSLMKLHLHLNSGSSTHWKYFLGVKDILPKNMTHSGVFVFLLAAPRCECLRVSGRITWECFL